MIYLTDSDRVFWFLLITASLGACFIRAFWELEQAQERRRLRATAREKYKAKYSTRRSAR
jgi:hypothetical protein